MVNKICFAVKCILAGLIFCDVLSFCRTDSCLEMAGRLFLVVLLLLFLTVLCFKKGSIGWKYMAVGLMIVADVYLLLLFLLWISLIERTGQVPLSSGQELLFYGQIALNLLLFLCGVLLLRRRSAEKNREEKEWYSDLNRLLEENEKKE